MKLNGESFSSLRRTIGGNKTQQQIDQDYFRDCEN